MYLSNLLIDLGSNPDRPRPGRLWLRNIYQVHQRLCMGFPTKEQRDRDSDFLRGFDESGFPLLRNPDSNAGGPRHSFLFRIDTDPDRNPSRAMILLQSLQEPDWDYAFRNARMLLAASPAVKSFNPDFRIGQEFRFRIRVNPTKKAKSNRKGEDLQKFKSDTDTKGRRKAQSKRISVIWESEKEESAETAILNWFAPKADRSGFSLNECHLIHLGWVTGYRPKTEDRIRCRSALLEGKLQVTDPETFLSAIRRGIGPAKAFGFGLLSLAPVRRG